MTPKFISKILLKNILKTVYQQVLIQIKSEQNLNVMEEILWGEKQQKERKKEKRRA